MAGILNEPLLIGVSQLLEMFAQLTKEGIQLLLKRTNRKMAPASGRNEKITGGKLSSIPVIGATVSMFLTLLLNASMASANIVLSCAYYPTTFFNRQFFFSIP